MCIVLLDSFALRRVLQSANKFCNRNVDNVGKGCNFTFAQERHLVELFDLTSDPRCERNLLESDLPRARTLHARLIRWLTDTPPSVWRHDVEASPAHGNMIRQLGYAENKDAWKEDGYIEADCACDHCTHMSG